MRLTPAILLCLTACGGPDPSPELDPALRYQFESIEANLDDILERWVRMRLERAYFEGFKAGAEVQRKADHAAMMQELRDHNLAGKPPKPKRNRRRAYRSRHRNKG